MAVLFVDDDRTGRDVAVYNLERAGLEVDAAESAEEALSRFRPERHEVVVTDVRLPGMDGIELLRRLRQRCPELPVVVITAYGSVERAVDAMRAGAHDFIEKPFSRDRLLVTVERALELARLRRENRRLRAEGGVERPIVAESPAMRRVLELADRVAPTSATVLVTGESGTGKELVARRIHARSARAGGPFVAVNCAAIPPELMESELFGHVRGAFTGAGRAREGRFRRANGGTLFLDEVGELGERAQAGLLRALQEGVVDVVGSDDPVPVDVRVVAATHRDLRALVAEGRFREDLLWRLDVFRIEVPPLRERPEDVVPLARVFLAEFAPGRDLELPDDVAAELRRRRWPGNVRQLRNACERLAILATGSRVRVGDLPPEDGPARGAGDGDWLDRLPEGLSLVDIEAMVVEHALERHGWNVSAAARALGVPRHILAYRIEKHGIRRGPANG